MAQTARWLWGLVPLALLWGAGNLFLGNAIERDVAQRAVAAVTSVAGEAPGTRPIIARVEGRDVSISGEALSTDGAARAMAQLRSESGVRRALGGLSQVVAQRPYSWSASRQGNAVTLNGFVPDEATARANVAAAGTALPGLRVDDRQSLAFGAPSGFPAMTKAILAELPKLTSGKVALDDSRFCIEGSARTPDDFLALQAAVAGLAQGGFQAVACALEPPVVAPYRWNAERTDDETLSVTGFYPSDAAREQILALLRRSFPGSLRIDERMKPALGEPNAFLAKVTRAIGDLARLRRGKAELSGDAYALSGDGPDSFEACQALRLQIAQLDGPDSVAQASIACPPAPPPPPLPEPSPLVLPVGPPSDTANASLPSGTAPSPAPASSEPKPPEVVAQLPPAPAVPLSWNAKVGEGRLELNGLVRDQAGRDALLEKARRSFPSSSITDTLRLEPNLRDEPDYGATTGFALEVLEKMRRGSVAVTDKSLALSGEVADAESWRALDAVLRRPPLPGGLTVQAGIGPVVVRPYGLSISVDGSGLNLTGYLPDQQSRDALLALAETSPLKGKVSDETTILPGAPADFLAAARLALVNLLRLDLGSATIVDDKITLRGLTCRELIKSEVETSAGSAQPAGFKIDAAIGLRQTGCVIDPPNTCQNDLDELTKRNTVLFGQGAAAVTLDATTERVIGEAFTILKQCPASRITIEGHTNRDGAWKGFDNLDLSERRAQRVRDELVRRGVDPAQLAVRGFGIERPLVPHGASDSRAMNRRVQFTVAK